MAKLWLDGRRDKLKLDRLDLKTRIVDSRTESFDFLGYTFGPEHHRRDGHWYLSAKPSDKSVKRLKETVRQRRRHDVQVPVRHPGGDARLPRVRFLAPGLGRSRGDPARPQGTMMREPAPWMIAGCFSSRIFLASSMSFSMEACMASAKRLNAWGRSLAGITF